MTHAQLSAQWADGDAYEAFMGRWSRVLAHEVLARLANSDGLRWLDVGCGTGALSQAILQRAAPTELLGVDRSPRYVAHARGTINDRRVRFEVADAQAHPFRDGSFDVAISGLVLNFIPEPERMLAEMRRVVRPGGRVAVYVWDYAAGMEFLRRFWDVAVALDPLAAPLDEGVRFPICEPERLSRSFQAAGCVSVEVRPAKIPTRFASFEEYWTPFLGGQGPAPSYVRTLDDAGRTRLREQLQRALSDVKDGTIQLSARAWVAHGRTPAEQHRRF